MTDNSLDLTNATPATLPAPNAASLELLNHYDTLIQQLRNEQHLCDSMLSYWQTRQSDVTRSINAVNAAVEEFNRTVTRVVTPAQQRREVHRRPRTNRNPAKDTSSNA